MNLIAEAASERKLQANRRNATRSTGPKTEDGKRRASQNALRHGAFSRRVLIRGENADDFDQLRKDMLLRLNPRDAIELRLAEQIIASQWKLQRLESAEQALLAATSDSIKQKTRSELKKDLSYWRGDVEYKRGEVQRCDSPENRKRLERAIASVEWHERALANQSDPEPAAVMQAIFKSKDPALERLGRAMRQLENSFNRAMRQLRELQWGPAEPEPSALTQSLVGSEEAESAADKTNPPSSEDPAGTGDTNERAPDEQVSPQPATNQDEVCLRETPAASAASAARGAGCATEPSLLKQASPS
jgi:hypothetical protein